MEFSVAKYSVAIAIYMRVTISLRLIVVRIEIRVTGVCSTKNE